jgi:FAD binding domain
MSSMVSFAAQNASAACRGFAEEVGGLSAGPVRVVGGGTHSTGLASQGAASSVAMSTRSVAAPSGIVAVEPEELIVRCGAGTTWAELDAALAAAGLVCPLDQVDSRSTVGGLLSVGFSGIRRSRYGHVRDLLLETRYVSAQGILVKAGAPVVKNVTGYDLCRLLVGSQGTLGFLSEVVLRCRPRPAEQIWLRCAEVDPFTTRTSLVSPGAVLWDGTSTYVLLEGTASEVRVGRQTLGPRWEVAGAPALDGFHYRRALRNSTIRTLTNSWRAGSGVSRPSAAGSSVEGSSVARSFVADSPGDAPAASGSAPALVGSASSGSSVRGTASSGSAGSETSFGSSAAGGFLAEIGVGTVHFASAADASLFDAAPLSAPVLALNQQLKAAFDPAGRLNPGVQPW